MDGKAVSDQVWCPGVVCSKQKGDDGGPVSPPEAGLVVDVMGQDQAEFPVTEDNIAGFPGSGEHLETVRQSVVEGLVSFSSCFGLICIASFFGLPPVTVCSQAHRINRCARDQYSTLHVRCVVNVLVRVRLEGSLRFSVAPPLVFLFLKGY